MRSLALALCALLTSCGCAGRSLRIESAGSPPWTACATVLSTAADRARGLIGRQALGDREALWLEWPTDVEACIHNSGVSFAIDELFVDSAGTIVAIERDVPAGDGSPRCHRGVRHVIELRAASAASLRVGAVVRWGQ